MDPSLSHTLCQRPFHFSPALYPGSTPHSDPPSILSLPLTQPRYFPLNPHTALLSALDPLFSPTLCLGSAPRSAPPSALDPSLSPALCPGPSFSPVLYPSSAPYSATPYAIEPSQGRPGSLPWTPHSAPPCVLDPSVSPALCPCSSLHSALFSSLDPSLSPATCPGPFTQPRPLPLLSAAMYPTAAIAPVAHGVPQPPHLLQQQREGEATPASPALTCTADLAPPWNGGPCGSHPLWTSEETPFLVRVCVRRHLG